MKNSWIAPVAALVVGAAGGYVSGKGSTPDAASEATALEEAGQRTRSVSRPGSASQASETARKANRVGSTGDITRMPGNSTRVQALMDFYAGLTPDQLADEAAKLEGLPMGERLMASFLLFGRWAEVDPTAAMAFSNTMGMAGGLDAADHADAYRSIAAQYGALDFSEAQSWIWTLPTDQQAAALASAIGGLANNDANAAAAQVKLLPAGESKDRLVGDVAGHLARKNPQEAADFIKGESEDAQRNAMRSLMAPWTSQNPAAALAFVNSYEPGRIRDSAAQSYVWGNNTSPPQELVRVAESITDEGERTRTIGVAAMRWMREDANEAKAYVESSSSLSDEAKERIIAGRGMWDGDRGGRGRGR